MTLRILGGRFKGRTIQSPSSSPTRPSQGVLRQAVFNICQQYIEGARFLDLFAGSGAMGLEALSRGALQAYFVERNPSAARVIRENISSLLVADQSKFLAMDVLRALDILAKQNKPFDIIYIDPPYGEPQTILSVLEKIERHRLSSSGGYVFFETSSKEPEIIFESSLFTKISIRQFGIARLYQYQQVTSDFKSS